MYWSRSESNHTFSTISCHFLEALCKDMYMIWWDIPYLTKLVIHKKFSIYNRYKLLIISSFEHFLSSSVSVCSVCPCKKSDSCVIPVISTSNHPRALRSPLQNLFKKFIWTPLPIKKSYLYPILDFYRVYFFSFCPMKIVVNLPRL